MTGIMRSRRTRLGRFIVRSRSRASLPCSAVTTSKPSPSRTSASDSRINGSSSTTRRLRSGGVAPAMSLLPVSVPSVLLDELRRRTQGELDDELGPPVGLARDPHLTAVSLGEEADDPEPEAEATVVADRRHALEPLEDPLERVGRDPDPVIADRQARDAPVARDRDEDGLAGAVLDGVPDEVRDDLVDAEPVPPPLHARVALHRDPRVRPSRLVLESLNRVPDLGDEVEVLELEADGAQVEPAHVEEPVDQGLEPLDGLIEPREAPLER